MSNIYAALSMLFHQPISDIARWLKYSESNIYILDSEFSRLREHYPDIWKALETCTHQRDTRTTEEYAQDLVSSWVYEDTMLIYLRKKFDIRLSGSDSKRNILSNKKILSDSDFCIQHNGRSFDIELINSYTNYWKNNKKIDLRDNKFKRLKDKAALLVCIDIYNKEFYLIDPKNTNHDLQYIPYHKPYGKPAYQISIQDHISF
jgi:hypothetical protein